MFKRVDLEKLINDLKNEYFEKCINLPHSIKILKSKKKNCDIFIPVLKVPKDYIKKNEKFKGTISKDTFLITHTYVLESKNKHKLYDIIIIENSIVDTYFGTTKLCNEINYELKISSFNFTYSRNFKLSIN